MKRTIFFIAFFIFILGCKKSENISIVKDPSSLKIKAGFECGWGTGEDSLIITSSTIKYFYYVPAESRDAKINTSRNVSDTEWVNIVNSINLNDFQKLNYNSCNLCVDGCDEWITIKTDQFSHQIRFGKGLKIDSINKLQNKLAQLRSEFSK